MPSAQILDRVTTRARALFGLVGVFGVSRLIYLAVGVRFDAWAITNSWQLLPQGLLEHDFVRSLWYLHSQPPLFNVAVGLTMHLPHARLLINIEFVLCTLVLALVMFLTMLELGVSQRLAFIAVTLFMISPTTVIYENWMYYTYPVALMLVTATWFFARYVRTKQVRDAAGVGFMLGGLALTRASYHLVFVIAGAIAVLLVTNKSMRRRVAAVLAIPVLLVGGWYLKNYVLFGEPNSSSWLGMNMAHMIVGNYPNEVQADIRSGALSPLAAVPPFIDLQSYNAHHAPTGVPALDRPLKQTGVNNYNNIAYIKISRQYEKDDVAFIKRHPDLYLRAFGDSFRTMFAPATDFIGIMYHKPTYDHLEPVVNLENHLLGQISLFRQPGRGLNTQNSPGALDIAWLVVLAYALTILGGVAVAVQSLRRRRWSQRATVFVFLAGLVTYAVVSANVFELGENMRFRLESDPLLIVGAATAVSYLWARWRTRTHAHDVQLRVADTMVPEPV